MEAASITSHPHPVTTRTQLADLERIALTHDPSQVNQPILFLVRARKALNDARIAIQAALRHYPTATPTRDALASIAASLRQHHHDFPLVILENGGNRPRPPIFPEHNAPAPSSLPFVDE